MQKNNLWNPDLSPVSAVARNWKLNHVIKFWVSMSISVPSYMIGAILVSTGMNWWQALLTVALGISIVLIPLLLLGAAGTKSGLPFPVLLRMSFGVRGARIAALLRAAVACGWFGIFVWIGGKAIYLTFIGVFPKTTHLLQLHGIDLSALKIISYALFLFIHVLIIHHGVEAVKKLESLAAPLLVILGLLLVIWCVAKVGSFNKILELSASLQKSKSHSFLQVFLPGLGSVIAGWIAVAVNIADITRYTKYQRDQIKGQIIGLLPTSILFAFIGIVATSATIIIYGHPMWNPVDFMTKLHHPIVLFIIMVGIMVATLTTNVGANMVPAANDFANFMPRFISFRTGGYIVAAIGTIVFPWKLLAGASSYIYGWLLAYIPVMCALGGIMLADYYLLRKTKIDIKSLFSYHGCYSYSKGWHIRAFLALIIAILPAVPGFLLQNNLFHCPFAHLFIGLYDYSWFVSTVIAIGCYWLMNRTRKISVCL